MHALTARAGSKLLSHIRKIATVLRRSERIADPATLVENISSVMFVALAAARNLDLDPPGLVDEIRRQIAVLIPD